MNATLLETRDIAPSVRHFVFEADEPLSFTPGQFVSFTQEIGGREITRAYSIASAPHGKRFELCLNLVPTGHFSSHLFTLEPGQSVPMRPPLGTFVVRHPENPKIFVANGTGITPFRSMLQSLPSDAPETLLLFGVRHRSGLLYADEFAELERANPHFHFWPTLTQPEPDWSGRSGRVQAHLEEAIAGRKNVDVYLCGLKAMVDDVRTQLKERFGFDRKQIFYEKYD